MAIGAAYHRVLSRMSLRYIFTVNRVRRNIITLELMGSQACQYDMEDIAQLFPCLEILSVENEVFGHGRLANYIARGRRGALSTKLRKLTALRTLKIHVYPDLYFYDYDDVTASLGPGNVLNLAQMSILQHLEVPF
ncbi:hypothetical protein INS49_005010 [Diaporthe citri]|uniref:uncharacterized protein n=1 Tax=Diaporthe citri TaxID=83186 RepID=UPI001C7FBC95|nr:uncharacterized protein INS49_005010 [Diaporthe citri]KAG6354039.1 hypothetical protein INS49_005010 [Diaporthe citri]